MNAKLEAILESWRKQWDISTIGKRETDHLAELFERAVEEETDHLQTRLSDEIDAARHREKDIEKLKERAKITEADLAKAVLFDDVVEDRNALRREITLLKRDNTSLRCHIDDRIADLKIKLGTAEKEIERLQAAYDSLTGEKFSERVHEVLRHRITKVEKENEQLKTELSKCAWHRSFEEYEEDNAALRKKLTDLQPSKTYPTDPVTGFPSENQDLDEPIRKVKEIAAFTVYEFWLGERLVTQVIASSKSEAQAKAIAEAPMLCDRPNENPIERVRAILNSNVKERGPA